MNRSKVAEFSKVVASGHEHRTQSNQVVYPSVSYDTYSISLLALFSRKLRVEEGKAAEYLIS